MAYKACANICRDSLDKGRQMTFIIIIIRHAPCQCVAPLTTNSLHSDLSKASSIASSKVRLCRDRSLFKVAIQEVQGRPTGLGIGLSKSQMLRPCLQNFRLLSPHCYTVFGGPLDMIEGVLYRLWSRCIHVNKFDKSVVFSRLAYVKCSIVT